MDTLAERTAKRFAKAVSALETALRLPELPERADRDAVLLRFELAAELMSKVLKRKLLERGAAPALPKDVVRSAVAAGMVAEAIATILLEVIDDRNRMVHDYSEQFSDALLRKVKEKYAHALRAVSSL
jgi:nucleotidyltransferase substrate binding protein (TIGR01987 family)